MKMVFVVGLVFGREVFSSLFDVLTPSISLEGFCFLVCDLMKVMTGVIGQIGQGVADNLFEIGQSTVKATADVAPGLVKEVIQQVTGSGDDVSGGAVGTKETEKSEESMQRKVQEKRRFNEVRAELDRYIKRKRELDARIVQERAIEEKRGEEEAAMRQYERGSWVKRVINRAATTTERGKMAE